MAATSECTFTLRISSEFWSWGGGTPDQDFFEGKFNTKTGWKSKGNFILLIGWADEERRTSHHWSELSKPEFGLTIERDVDWQPMRGGSPVPSESEESGEERGKESEEGNGEEGEEEIEFGEGSFDAEHDGVRCALSTSTATPPDATHHLFHYCYMLSVGFVAV